MTDGVPAGVRGTLLLPAGAYRRNRGPWLVNRRTGIGASETAAILGLHPWHTATDVWLSKMSTGTDDTMPSEAAEWGLALEDTVARRAVKRHRWLGKLVPTPGLLAHEEHPKVLATVDRLLAERRVEPLTVTSVLEVKTVSKMSYDLGWADGVPTYVKVQVQQQLAVTGLRYAWVVVLVGGQYMPKPYRVDRDEESIEMIIEAIEHWHRLHIEEGVRPEPEFPSDAENLSRLWPGDPNAPTVVADEHVRSQLARYLRARAARKNAEDVMADAVFRVQKHLGDATELVDEDGDLIATWRPQTARRIDQTLLKEAHPDIAAEVTKEVRSRVFRAKEIDA